VTQEKTYQGIHKALTTGDSDMLQACIRELATFCFKEPSPEQEMFPMNLFDYILRLMADDNLLKMDGAYHLLMLFEYDWARLDEKQKERLLAAIVASYHKFKDWMAYFVITELLGQYYCNESSFQVLCELQTTENEIARSLLAHGFEHIAREGENSVLRALALNRLISMKDDHSVIVQNEVSTALANLS
jgi:hypothetical protein